MLTVSNGGIPSWAILSSTNILTISSAARTSKLFVNTFSDYFEIQDITGASLNVWNRYGDSRQTVQFLGIKDVYHGANVITREYGNPNYSRFYSITGVYTFTINVDDDYILNETTTSGIYGPKYVLRGDRSSGSWFVLNDNAGIVAVKYYPASYHYLDKCLRVGGADIANAAQFCNYNSTFSKVRSAAILTILYDKMATFSSYLLVVYASNITSVASSTTPTPDSAITAQYNITTLAVAATFSVSTGIPRIKDNGTARVLAYNAIYRAIGVTLPLTTVIIKFHIPVAKILSGMLFQLHKSLNNMKYLIIDRIKYNKNTTLGYESNIDLEIETNYQHSITLGEWLNSNKIDLEEPKVSI